MNRIKRYVGEAAVGLITAVLVFLALVATVGVVPFIYQGF